MICKNNSLKIPKSIQIGRMKTAKERGKNMFSSCINWLDIFLLFSTIVHCKFLHDNSLQCPMLLSQHQQQLQWQTLNNDLTSFFFHFINFECVCFFCIVVCKYFFFVLISLFSSTIVHSQTGIWFGSLIVAMACFFQQFFSFRHFLSSFGDLLRIPVHWWE